MPAGQQTGQHEFYHFLFAANGIVEDAPER